MGKFSFKKIIFVGLFFFILFSTISLFLIDEENPFFSQREDFDKELFEFEENFFKKIDSELESLYLQYSELSVPEEKIIALSDDALNTIKIFREKNRGFLQTSPEADFRLKRLELFVYINILSDRLKSEELINSLANDEDKLASVEDYIDTFSFTAQDEVNQFLLKNKTWINSIKPNYFKEIESKVFLAAPIGKAFPNYLSKYKDIKGQSLDLSEVKDEVILIDFWATWCVPCISELPYLIEAKNAYGDKGFKIVSISLDENREGFFQFLRKWGIDWVQYFDGKGFAGDLVREYGIKSLPTTFLLGKDGKVIEKDLQGTELLRILNKLLNE